jgi:hypothetical protein
MTRMRIVLLLAAVLCSALASAKVTNVEFKFTPYTGNPKDDHVEVVAGKARVLLNNVPVAEQDVTKQTVPVLFEDREIAAAVRAPVTSLGPGVRQGKNTIRIEFQPADAKTPYHAQLRWASITDRAIDEKEPGRARSTNQADEGVEDKPARGRVVLEHAFTAEFARDRPWHHAPAVTALTRDDKRRLAALVRERAGWFEPDFASIYKALEQNEQLNVADLRKGRCLDAAYKAGVRIVAATNLEFATTGGPEVVVRAKAGPLFSHDQKAFERLRGGETQMCAGLMLAAVYPQRLVAVKTAAGWEIVY